MMHLRAANGPVAIDKGWKHVRAEVVLDTFAGRLHEGDVDVTKNLRTGKRSNLRSTLRVLPFK